MAVLSSSRGVAAANVDKTKHLFLIFTLLTLLCPASSVIDDDKLKLIRENILKLQQDAVMRKVDNMVDITFLPDLFEDLLKLMDSLAGTTKNLLPNIKASATRTMKGLFLICTLISLVGFTKSLLDKKQLAELKETNQQLKEMLEEVKNGHRSAIDQSSELMTSINYDPLREMTKEVAEQFPDEVLELKALMKKTKDVFLKMKSSLDKKNDDLFVKIQELESKMKETDDLINFFEGLKDEF